MISSLSDFPISRIIIARRLKDRGRCSTITSQLRWTPDFNEEELILHILTWVRLPKLPINFFNHTVVTRIGNHIGLTIRLDLATSEGAMARYASVCVVVDLSKSLLGK
ncbi:hypothetical protein LINPERHAP2_LOCUS39796 [Linum perenne]